MFIGNHVIQLERNEKVILANCENGKWIRMSKEVYKIILDIVNSDEDINLIQDYFEDEEDFEFCKDIYDSLKSSEILCDNSYQIKNRNKIASIQLTNRCNLKCKHCCVEAMELSEKEKDLSTEKIKQILDKVIVWNPLDIMISGGEPMVRSDFIEILTYLREDYRGNIILSTNSLLINRINAEKLVKLCDSFEISIDGVDEQSCSIVRGQGVFEQVCSRVKLLKEVGAVNINLSMVFSDKNQHLLQKFYELNEKLGTNPVCRVFSAIGRGEKNKALFSDKDEKEIYIPEDYLDENYDKPFGVSFCSAGKREIFIGCDGSVYPCPSYMSELFCLGNILECENLNTLLQNGQDDSTICNQVLNIHPYNLEQCKKCDVRLFCWTCPGEFQEIKTKEAFDARCKRIKPILIKRVWEKRICM